MRTGDSVSTFQAGNDRRLRREGLAGRHVWGSLSGDALTLRGDEGGTLHIRREDVARLRVGYVEAKRRIYQVQIWRAGAAGPLTLVPSLPTWGAYAQVMRGFVVLLADGGRLDRVETGSGKVDAVLAPVLMAPVALAALWLALFVLTEEPWWGRLLVPAVPVGLFVLFLWTSIARKWPRPLLDLADLKGHLPPV